MKRLLLLPLLCIAVAASAQFNLQFHYDLGRHMNPESEANRQIFTVTAEFFKADRLGQTFLFIDMDYRGDGPQNNGAIGAYWEMSRDFTFAKVKNTNSNFSAHIEYDGGVNPVRGLELHWEITGDRAKVGGEGHNASPSVAAHHPTAAVRVVEDHLEVLGFALLKQHHPIGAESGVPVTETAYLGRAKAQKTLPVVRQKKVISCSVIFEELL